VFIRPPLALGAMAGPQRTDDTVLSLGTCLVILATVTAATRGPRLDCADTLVSAAAATRSISRMNLLVVWMTALYARVRRGSPLIWIAAEVALAAVLGAVVARWFSEPMNRKLRGAASPARSVASGESLGSATPIA